MRWQFGKANELNPSLGDRMIVLDRTAADPNRPDEGTFLVYNRKPSGKNN
jgi:hypothetical protein